MTNEIGSGSLRRPGIVDTATFEMAGSAFVSDIAVGRVAFWCSHELADVRDQAVQA